MFVTSSYYQRADRPYRPTTRSVRPPVVGPPTAAATALNATVIIPKPISFPFRQRVANRPTDDCIYHARVLGASAHGWHRKMVVRFPSVVYFVNAVAAEQTVLEKASSGFYGVAG